jgi:hypothetical protein
VVRDLLYQGQQAGVALMWHDRAVLTRNGGLAGWWQIHRTPYPLECPWAEERIASELAWGRNLIETGADRPTSEAWPTILERLVEQVEPTAAAALRASGGLVERLSDLPAREQRAWSGVLAAAEVHLAESGL